MSRRCNYCLDSNKDTDADTLDDRFETLLGWDIETKLNSGRVRSSCRSKDTDGDGLPGLDEAPGVLKRDPAGDPSARPAPSTPTATPTAWPTGSSAGWVPTPRVDNRAEFWDSDRDGLPTPRSRRRQPNFVIDPEEIKANAGWNVVATQMHAARIVGRDLRQRHLQARHHRRGRRRQGSW